MLLRRGRIQMFMKETPASSVMAIILGIISIVLFVVIGVLSCVHMGDAGIVIGILGVVAMVINLIGFYISVKSFKKDDIYYSLPMVSLGINGIMFVVYFSFYLYGFLLKM